MNSDVGVTPFMQNKLEKDAKKNWDLFYKRNGDRFFKDRHWTIREFNLMCEETDQLDHPKPKILMEIGCGVGNFIFPLIEEKVPLFFYGCDFSTVAVDICNKNPTADQEKCSFFVADLTSDFECKFRAAASTRGDDGVDIVSLIFVLSAIHPDKMERAVANVFQVLNPGGMVMFRDYGMGDHAMKRFKPESRLLPDKMDNFYVRQDGTRAFYFTPDMLHQLFVTNGFEVITNSYVYRKTTNIKEDIDVVRTFIQSKFRKPFTPKENVQTL